jgi:hypothetical protein
VLLATTWELKSSGTSFFSLRIDYIVVQLDAGYRINAETRSGLL